MNENYNSVYSMIFLFLLCLFQLYNDRGINMDINYRIINMDTIIYNCIFCIFHLYT